MRALSAINQFLLFVILAATHLQYTNAGLLDSLRVAIWGEENTGEDQPRFYQEDVLANVLMMADFINTPLYLVALFKWRLPLAVYEDGRETVLTGFEADRIYTQAMFSDIVPNIGGELKFISNIEASSILKMGNDTDEEPFHQHWDALAVIKFPSGLAFGRMLTNQTFQELSPNKKAGLEYHAIFACELVPGSSMDAAAVNSNNVDTQDDAPVAMVDLLDYQSNNNGVTFEYDTAVSRKYHGMRTAAAFKIKYSLLQGSSGWDEVRINTFPSHVALEAAMADSGSWMLGGFKDGLQRASTFQVSPMFVNSLGGNAQTGYLEACDSEEAKAAASTKEYDMSLYCP